MKIVTDALTALPTTLGIVLVVFAAVWIGIAAARFVEEAFAVRRKWGYALVVPPLAGLVLYVVGGLLGRAIVDSSVTFAPGIVCLILVAISPIAAGILAVKHWPRFRAHLLGLAVGAAYLIGWAVIA